ncbi:class I SAM-dependent RNA methyltransferase [Calidifontibacter indicus]|uniref:class I SAM-dependent RNA methyltransferase n=1 Tax=Calidifontibacter indicus TaxID=419650 RepID=UPI003D73AB44
MSRGRSERRRPRARSNQGRSLVGQEYEVEVGPVAHGGHCVARHDGRVLFVRHALPGETVVARVTDGGEKSRFLRADAVRVVTPSAHRVDDGCPFAGPGRCGGCDWQHTTAAHQRELKTAVVREQLRRLAGYEWTGEVEPLLGDDDGAGWRTRVEFSLTRDRRLGLLAHRSHDVVAVDPCRIADPRIAEVGLYDERFEAGVTSVDVTTTSRGEVIAVELPLRDDEVEPIVVEDVTAARETHSFRVNARGFWQVHPGAAPTFVTHVLAELAAQPGEHVLDLYCGVGLFAGFLADAVGAEHVIGIEGDEAAVDHARDNVPGATFIAGDVTEQLRYLDAPTDLVVLDPPRTGAGREVIEQILQRGPRAVAYVACDPAALGRDVGYAAEFGYQVRSVRGFDAFPMTHHVECVALLTKTGSDLH